jgi:hypothetical protein
MELACPMCKYPFGSGGNRNLSRSFGNPLERSSSIICSIKLRGFFSSLITGILKPQRYEKWEYEGHKKAYPYK